MSNIETKNIETYSLFEFCQKVQEAILGGWKFDFESNANFPTAYGSMLVCGMVKNAVPQVQVEIKQDEEVKEEESVKQGISARKSRKVNE